MKQKQVHGTYFGRSGVFFTKSERRHAEPTKVKMPESDTHSEIASWGDDNQYPQKFIEALNKNGAAGGGLRILKSAHYGNGIVLYKNKTTEQGKRQKIIVYKEDYPTLNSFWKQNKFNKFIVETIADLETFGIAFPEFIVSKNFRQVVQVRRQKAAWCRREIINEKSLISENIYICSNWESADIDEELTAKVPSIDPYWTADEVREYCQKKKIYKFIIPIYYPMMDEAYYNKPDWHAIYKSGWMEVSNSIPKFKKFLFENQINLKYMIYISEQYFEHVYKQEWDDFDADRRKKIREELIDSIDNHLSGNESSGRSMFAPLFKDRDDKWVKGIEVIAIDNKLKDGNFLSDASAANSEILFAQGVDPSLIGAGIPGGKLGSGSGSDKREAFSILSAIFKTKRETTLEIWEFIKSFNGWPDDIQAGFENMLLTTLDKNPTGQQNTTQ